MFDFFFNSIDLTVLCYCCSLQVGEYLILHVRTNFYAETFNYIVVSKGIVLLTGSHGSSPSVTTLSIPLSAEMAPVATVVIYHVAKYGEVVADSLTFPVNGISRNNFTLTLNPMKDKTGDTVEVVVLGDPGAYVGISAIDKGFFNMQVSSKLQLSYSMQLQIYAEMSGWKRTELRRSHYENDVI